MRRWIVVKGRQKIYGQRYIHRERACVSTVPYIWDWQQLTLKWVGTSDWHFEQHTEAWGRNVFCHTVLESCFLTVGLRVVYLNLFVTVQKTGPLTDSAHFPRQHARLSSDVIIGGVSVSSVPFLTTYQTDRKLKVFTSSCSRGIDDSHLEYELGA